MRKSLPILLLVLASGGIARPDEPSPATRKDQPVIKVALAIPELSDGKTVWPRELGNRNADAHFFVTLENTSSSPLFIKERICPLQKAS